MLLHTYIYVCMYEYMWNCVQFCHIELLPLITYTHAYNAK